MPEPGHLGIGLPGTWFDGIRPPLTPTLPGAFHVQGYPAAILAQTLPKSPIGLAKDLRNRHF